MTLVSTIIRDAYRESNLISITADPTTAEQDEGLSLLNRLRASVYGNEAGEQLDPVLIGRNNINRPQGFPWYDQVPDQTLWFVPPNSRLILNLTNSQTVYLDPNPDDGARFAILDKSNNLATYPLTVNGNGRTLGGAVSTVFNTDGIANEYIYRSDLGDWTIVNPLTAADTWPFPLEFDSLFVIGLAMRLNPRHATQADPQSLGEYERVLRQFRARYRQHVQTGSELGLIRTPGTKRRYYDDIMYANILFNSGHAYPYGYRQW